MGRSDLPSVFGIFNFFIGIGTVTMPAITGALVDHFNTYRAPFIFFAAAQVTMDVFLVKMTNAFVSIERIYSMNTYSRISTVL